MTRWISSILLALSMGVCAAHAQSPSPQAPDQTGRISDELPRRVWLGTVFGPRDVEAARDPREALRVTRVIKDATADRAGVQEGDILLAVNDSPVTDWTQVAALTRTPRAGDAGFVTVERAGKPLRLATTWVAMPMETVPGVTTRYSSVRAPGGYLLRTIIASPNRAPGEKRRLPAFLYIQGLACVSIDRATMTGFPDTDMPRELASRGFVTMRVDKPGVGDSQGPPCSEIDFSEELAAYRAAFDSLVDLPEVDPARVYIFGYSFGGVFAPFVAQDKPVAGIAVYGTTARTWLEYELENTRRQMTVLQEPPALVSERLQHASEFQSMLLLQKMTPGEIFAAKPALRFEAPLMDDTHQYGRHARFFHEVQDRNVAAAWDRLPGLPVLAMHGEYDWVSSAEDADLIVRIAQSKPGGMGEVQIMPGLDHGMTRHGSLAESITRFAQGQWTGAVSDTVIDWVSRTARVPARKPLPPDSK